MKRYEGEVWEGPKFRAPCPPPVEPGPFALMASMAKPTGGSLPCAAGARVLTGIW